MTSSDLHSLLRRACTEHGQSVVARRIGRSPSALSQVLSGKYQGDPSNILSLVEEEFGGVTVECPVYGYTIPLKRCARERRNPRHTNPVSRMLANTCPTCPHNGRGL
ncbi:MAG: helix-turn-helix transcriptional regulator [Desulfuromonadales bacterium]|nr:helix-turn-helix transcriptional regulator [Desulfuromonadales bacterium]MDW7758928.1 helix-turn-helix transcriptional regulator [Desulfuromonadales bacterium]